MLAGTNAHRNLSANKMKENEVLRTVEGLRGRLVSERAISKAAKDDALLMGNKLMELENKLKGETNLKKKAEKKLDMLVKKLESLKIHTVSKEHYSSTSSTSPGVDSEQIQQSKSQFSSSMNSDTEQDPKQIVAEATNTEQNDSIEDMSTTTTGTSTTTFPDSNSDQIDGSPVEIKEEIEQSSYNYSNLKSSNEEAEKSDGSVDNTMALVLVPESSLQMASSESKDKPETVISGNAREVLDALRHAREQIQRAMERRRMLNAGSIKIHIC